MFARGKLCATAPDFRRRIFADDANFFVQALPTRGEYVCQIEEFVTAGTAVLAAGAIALGPVVTQAPEALRATRAADLALSAAANPIEAAAIIAEGFGLSGVRFVQGSMAAPLGLIPIVQALGAQDNDALYAALREYNDGPLWVVDPTIDGFAQALPRSLGGGTDGGVRNVSSDLDGAVVKFRDKALWVAADAVGTGVAVSVKKPRVTGSANLGKYLPGVSAPEGATGTESATRTRPGRAAARALRNQVRASVAKVNAGHFGRISREPSRAPWHAPAGSR